MDVQFTEEKLIELYIEVDDLHQAYLLYRKDKGLGALRHPTRVPSLNAAEICTILAAYHYSGFKCFEYYYRQIICHHYADWFPDAPSYERFLTYIERVADLMYLWMLYTTAKSQRTGLYFIDSKKLEVCHIKRTQSNKVFAGLARKGKSSTGWFYGYKIHLVINNLGEIISFDLTTANVADNNQSLLKNLLDKLDGYCIGDKGYLSKLFGYFIDNGLHLLTKPRKNMRKLPVIPKHNLLINKRAVVESVFDILKTVCDIEHSRHRKPINAAVHIYGSLIAYQYMDKKPRVFYPSMKQNQMALAA